MFKLKTFVLVLAGMLASLMFSPVAIADDPDPIPDPTCGLWCYLEDLEIVYIPDPPVGDPHFKIFCYPHWGDTTSGHTVFLAVMSIEVKSGGEWSEPTGQILDERHNCENDSEAFVLYMLPETGWTEVKITLDVYCVASQSHVQDHKHGYPTYGPADLWKPDPLAFEILEEL
ncbi:MAG: hypothetical protein ACYSW8_33420 [Planctomycetota bacterium]|jgi:hypothetical protein